MGTGTGIRSLPLFAFVGSIISCDLPACKPDHR